MGTLYLVRHGQASFGSDNYDRLSPRGHAQCERLGRWFRDRGVRFEAALTGTLVRQAESHAAIVRGLGDLAPAGEVLRLPALDEYHSEALIATVHSGPLSRERTPEVYRQHFRLLREALLRWMAGQSQPAGMPSFADFRAGIVAALEHVRQRHDGDVLAVSSGGPISTAVGHVLGAPDASVIELNMRLRNSAVTEFVITPKRPVLLSFNTLPHLDGLGPDEVKDWITYA